MIRATVYSKSAIIASLPESESHGLSFTYTTVHESEIMPRLIFGFVLGLATIFQCLNPHGWRFVIAVKAVALPNSESLALLRAYALQALRPGVLMVDRSCFFAGIHPTNAPLTLERLASIHLMLLLYCVFKWSHRSLFVLFLLNLGAVPHHTRRESRTLWPLLVFDKSRSWRSNGIWPTAGWVTVRVEQPSIGHRAIMQHVHAQLPMVDFKHRREMHLRLERVLRHVAIHETAAKPLIRTHRDFMRSALRDSNDDPPPDRALGSTLEQKRPPVAVKVTKSTQIVQVFVKTFEGKSITINNVTGRTSVEDLKLKVKEKAGMRGVWPELKYQGAWLHDGKILSTYGIDEAATLEMTWRLLGGGLAPAPAPNTGAGSSHAAANTIVPPDENNASAAKPGPRPRSISPSVATANANEKGMNAQAAHKPTSAFTDERGAHRQDATDSRTLAECVDDALLPITVACNIESLEDEAADMVPHNMEASKVARQAPAFEIAAVNSATALDASLAAESAGVHNAHPPLLSRTHAHRRQVGRPRFGFRRECNGHGIRHTVPLCSRALRQGEVISSLVGRGHVL
jgi:hypothetical protein